MSPQINPSLPTVGGPDSSEEPKVVTAFAAIIGAINGGLDTSNLATSAGVLDTQLASPNNAVWRPVAEYNFSMQSGITAGDYGLKTP
jgi:hypothetical protein